MEKSEISQKMIEVLTSILKHQNFEIRDDLVAAEVEGWDSLNHMTIISGIEEKFDIKFKLRELNKLRNMGTLIELVQSKL
ncbi:MAG: acyl carrier protein [Bacteroidales bacterium]|nr:acyl carrier protein [Bacteroidales bacterium]